MAVLNTGALTSTPSPQIIVKIVTDDHANVFVDGKQIITTKTLEPQVFTISASSRLFALEIFNVMFTVGFTLTMSNGVVSDTSWKCTSAPGLSGWQRSDYNDISWPFAERFIQHKYLLLLPDDIIPPDNWWISVSNSLVSHMYCRKFLHS